MLEQEDLLAFMTGPSTKHSDKPLLPLQSCVTALCQNLPEDSTPQGKKVYWGETPNTVPNMWNSPTVNTCSAFSQAWGSNGEKLQTLFQACGTAPQ